MDRGADPGEGGKMKGKIKKNGEWLDVQYDSPAELERIAEDSGVVVMRDCQNQTLIKIEGEWVYL